MSATLFDCPNCGAELSVEEANLGLRLKCPHCRKPFVAGQPKASTSQAQVQSPTSRPQNKPHQEVFVAKMGKATGPFSEDQLRSMLNSGMVGPADPAWHEGLTEWLPVQQILNGAAAPKPVPAPAQLPAESIQPPPPIAVKGSVLKWLLFVPGGLIAGLIISGIVVIALGGICWLLGLEIRNYFVSVFGGLVFGISAVSIGSSIAPSDDKRKPALVMAAFVCAASFLAGCFAASIGDLMGIVQSVVMILTAFLARRIVGEQALTAPVTTAPSGEPGTTSNDDGCVIPLVQGWWFLTGFVCLAAIFSLVNNVWHLHWLVAGPVALILAWIPLVGTIMAVWGAVVAWDWSWWRIVFWFWGPYITLLVYGFFIVAKEIWKDFGQKTHS